MAKQTKKKSSKKTTKNQDIPASLVAMREDLPETVKAQIAQMEEEQKWWPKNDVAIPASKFVPNPNRLVVLVSRAQLEKRIQEAIAEYDDMGFTTIACGMFQVYGVKLEADPMEVWADVASEGVRRWVRCVSRGILRVLADEALCQVEADDQDGELVTIPKGRCWPQERTYKLRATLEEGVTIEIDDAHQVQIMRRADKRIPAEVY